MTQLHSREVDLFRSLKRTAIVLMVLFRLDRPLGECEIAGILEMDRGTIRIYLRSLARQGMVTRSHRFHGWILTAGGRQMVLGESSHERLEERAGEPTTMVENPASLPATTAEAIGMVEISTSMVENPSSSAENSSTMVENPPSLPATEARTMVENPPSVVVENPPSSAENPSSMAEIPSSLPPTRPEAGAMVENPPSLAEDPSSSAENPSTRVENPPSMMENPSSMAENPPSAPLAAASLSLNSLSLKALAAAATAGASGKNCRSNGKISRSRLRPRMRKAKRENRAANGSGRTDPMVEANLEAFASIGLAQNDFVLAICRMDHVTPGYILGQKRRLEAEGRYSGGLLLRVVECGDFLAEEYVVGEESDPPQPPLKGGERGSGGAGERQRRTLLRSRGEQRRGQVLEGETELEEEAAGVEIEPDDSIHQPLSAGGMTAARAWTAVLRELQSDIPRATYERWVRDTVLLSARDGIFVIGAQSSYTRDWLESRLTSTIKRFLSGMCKRSMQVRFVDLTAWGQ